MNRKWTTNEQEHKCFCPMYQSWQNLDQTLTKPWLNIDKTLTKPVAKPEKVYSIPERVDFNLLRRFTFSNSAEMFAAHQLITKGLHLNGKDYVTVYFTDSYSSLQKGCVENTNKLIRKYIPHPALCDIFSAHYLMIIPIDLTKDLWPFQ